MNAHITVLSQRQPGHKLFCPAVTTTLGDERFLYPQRYRKRSEASDEARRLAKLTGIPYVKSADD